MQRTCVDEDVSVRAPTGTPKHVEPLQRRASPMGNAEEHSDRDVVRGAEGMGVEKVLQLLIRDQIGQGRKTWPSRWRRAVREHVTQNKQIFIVEISAAFVSEA